MTRICKRCGKVTDVITPEGLCDYCVAYPMNCPIHPKQSLVEVEGKGLWCNECSHSWVIKKGESEK